MASVIAALLMILFIQPVLRLLWRALNGLGSPLINRAVDAAYSNAALGQRDFVSVVLLILLATFPIGAAIGFVVARLALRKGLSGDAEKSPLIGRMPVLLRIAGIASMLALLVLAAGAFADLQLNTSFQQRLTVLAPVVSDQEVKELKALWATMSSRRDYTHINGRLDRLAHRHGIKLPKPLL